MSRKILIVDDEKLNRKLFGAIFEYAGYIIIQAEDGQQAIQLAKETIPDLILMDIQMPVMDGIEALRILKSEPTTKDILVIAFTFHDSTKYQEKLLEYGFNGFISKSIGTKEILNAIKSIFG
ncbi:MAG: response regulator [Thermodesulfovibrionales bacterium]|nr:response regulator [Thermodesulfovibrionales bacterium]